MQKRRWRSRNVATVILPISTALFLAGCDTNHATLADCERARGAGNCAARPQAVLMTPANRPSYPAKDKCEADFGEQRCEPNRRIGTTGYHPLMYPGQTWFYPHGSYPGYAGYYDRSPQARPVVTTPRFAPKTSIASGATRGGFGSTGAGRSVGG
ncbi:MAG: DUF1190 domain-containing protein [Patescibacteria group bacterium]